MAKKWSFDKQFLEEVINKGYVLLEDPKVSKSRKSGIRCDIRAFENFISKKTN
jgi:leucyl-tRNA synthetase